MWSCVVMLRVHLSIRDDCDEISESAILTFVFYAELLYFEFIIEYRRSRTLLIYFKCGTEWGVYFKL